MADNDYYFVKGSQLTSIADAIREKTGGGRYSFLPR